MAARARQLGGFVIRRAEVADIPELVGMGRRFLAMSPHSGMGEFDAEAVARVLRFMIESPTSLVLTNGDGAIGGVQAPLYFDPSRTMMEESFWWAEKGGRDLLKAFQKESALMGSHYLMLSTLENDRSHLIDRLVSAMGYRPLERRYVKELC